MRITVTEDHIIRGSPGEPSDCPVALALTDAGLGNVSVNPFMAGWGEPREYMGLPEAAKVFISRFDADLKTEPFDFELVGAKP